MRKSTRGMGLALAGLLAALAALAVQAQDTEPITQPTVDAAVSTLLAQTQQAHSGISATQTIQVALNNALTATAQAPVLLPTTLPGTPQPTLDVSRLRVASQTDFDLMAGPGATGAYLAPDGVHFAHLRGDRICIYAGEQEQGCVDLTEDFGRLDWESITWSPDSRYLAMTEDFFRTFNDPDIWVVDTADLSLKNLTDDGQLHIDIGGDTWKNIDVAPHWLPDNHLIFLRFSRIQDEPMPPMIYTLSPDGGSPQKLGTVQSDDAFAVYSMQALENHLVYGYAASGETPNNGVWISDLDGGTPRQIVASDREHLPTWVDMSPDGRYVLVGAPGYSMTYKPEDSLVYLVDVENGVSMPIDPERYVMGAGWAPTGSTLIYTTFDALQPDRSGVYVSGMPGTAGQELLAGRYNAATSTLRQPIPWAANNVVLLSRSPEKGIVLLQLET